MPSQNASQRQWHGGLLFPNRAQIFDQCQPEAMPLSNTVFVGRLPPAPQWLEAAGDEPIYGPQIIDWQRSHPLLNLIELGNVQIVDTQIVKPPLGGRVLVVG